MSTYKAAEKRRTYELLFYSQDLSRDGSIAIDSLECGTQICAAELRASDSADIEEFIASTTNSNDFEGYAIMRISGSQGGYQSQRLVFAHDPTIQGITFPIGAHSIEEKKH